MVLCGCRGAPRSARPPLAGPADGGPLEAGWLQGTHA